MSMKRGYCLACKVSDDKKRIFEVNSDATICYCPHCMKKYKPSVAIANYLRHINTTLVKANFYLKNATETSKAYGIFADVLELEPNSLKAKIGRILSLAYLSTLRKDYFSECVELIQMDLDKYHGVKILPQYKELLTELERCSNKYFKSLNKKLTLKGYFFDADCVRLYYARVNTLINFKRFIIEQFTSINETTLAEGSEARIKILEQELTKSIVTADGTEHQLVNFNSIGEPLISNSLTKQKTKLERYRLSSLDPKNKKTRTIKDNMFRSYRGLYHFNLATIPMAIICAIISAVFFAGYIFLKYSKDTRTFVTWSSNICFVTFIVALSLAFIFLIFRLIFTAVLKKPRV